MEERTTGIRGEKDEWDERWERREAANSAAGQAGVEEGIWTELWSRSLPVRLTQQQPATSLIPQITLHHGRRDRRGMQKEIVRGIKHWTTEESGGKEVLEAGRQEG